MDETKSPGKEPGRASVGEPTTPGVQSARNAVSETMTAVGDVLGATVQAVADVGEDVVHGVGRVALTAVGETTNVLTGVAGGLRDIFSAGVSSRTRNPESGRRP
jgi:hypothetical protein